MIAKWSGLVHDLIHAVAGLDYPHDHWWMVPLVTLILVVAPIWTALHLMRLGARGVGVLRRRRAQLRSATDRGAGDLVQICDVPRLQKPLSDGRDEWKLEVYVLRSTGRLQIPLLVLSLLILPAAWLLLEIPKHIINHALGGGEGHGGMTFLGIHLGRIELLFALCSSYLAVLTASGLVKYFANKAAGRINERLVRRLRLRIARRAHTVCVPDHRATLAAIAIQEVEPIGYFGGSLTVVPLIQGGTLITSLLFLFVQNAALALAALIMLPVQLTLLPRLQRRLNAKIRSRVYATRALSGLLTAPVPGGNARRGETDEPRAPPILVRQMCQTKLLEKIRIEINDLKGQLKGVYNYSSNLTPFFLFALGGYLVVQERLSLGALVAALAAYKEIAPALRALFDFVQNWSDARARFEEITKVLAKPHSLENG